MMSYKSWTIKIKKYQIKKKNSHNIKITNALNSHYQTNHSSNSRSLLTFLNDTFKKQNQNKRNHQFSI